MKVGELIICGCPVPVAVSASIPEDEWAYYRTREGIVIGTGVPPRAFTSVLMHEVWHAIRDLYGNGKKRMDEEVEANCLGAVMERNWQELARIIKEQTHSG